MTEFTVFFLTYFIFGFSVFVSLKQTTNIFNLKYNILALGIFSLGIAPIVCSILLSIFYTFYPGINRAIVFISVLIAFAFLAKDSIPDIKKILAYLNNLLHNLKINYKKLLKLDLLVFFLIIFCIFMYIFWQGVAYPICSHDGAIYEVFGRIFDRDRSLEHYLVVKPDAKTGFFSPIKHLPGLPLIYAWFNLASCQDSILPRTVSPIYSLYIVVLLSLFLSIKKGIYHALLGSITLLCTPAFVWQAFENSIDPPRMFFFLSAVFFLYFTIKENSFSFLVLGILGILFSIWLHISGILMLLSCLIGLLGIAVYSITKNYFKNRNFNIFEWKIYLFFSCILVLIIALLTLNSSSRVGKTLNNLFVLSDSYDKGEFEFRGIYEYEEKKIDPNRILLGKILEKVIDCCEKNNQILIIGKKVALPSLDNHFQNIIFFFDDDNLINEQDEQKILEKIYALKVKYVVIDPRYDGNEIYLSSKLKTIIQSNKFFSVIYRNNDIIVYKLKEPSTSEDSDTQISKAIENTSDTNRILFIGGEYKKVTDSRIIKITVQDFENTFLSGINKQKNLFRKLISHKVETIIINLKNNEKITSNSVFTKFIEKNRYYNLIFTDREGLSIYQISPRETYEKFATGINFTPKIGNAFNITNDELEAAIKYQENKNAIEGKNFAITFYSRTKDFLRRIFNQKNILGRMQIFTQPQLFGISFYIFIFSVIAWFLKYKKTKEEIFILLVIILFALPVIFKYYLNRRYILTVLPLCCYFSGLALGDFYVFIKERKFGKYFLFGLLLLPLIILTTFTFKSSQTSHRFFGNNDFIKYFLSNKLEQNNILYPGLITACEYLNANAPTGSKVITSNNAQFFAFCKHYGIYWNKNEYYEKVRVMPFLKRDEYGKYPFVDIETGERFELSKIQKKILYIILQFDVDYVLIDPVSEQKRHKELFAAYNTVLSDEKIAKIVYDNGTKIWKINKNIEPFRI